MCVCVLVNVYTFSNVNIFFAVLTGENCKCGCLEKMHHNLISGIICSLHKWYELQTHEIERLLLEVFVFVCSVV